MQGRCVGTLSEPSSQGPYFEWEDGGQVSIRSTFGHHTGLRRGLVKDKCAAFPEPKIDPLCMLRSRSTPQNPSTRHKPAGYGGGFDISSRESRSKRDG